MILILLKLIFFIATIYFFGWQFSRRVLKQNELYLTLPLSLVIGVNAYVILVNALGYLIPIQQVFWIILFVLLFSSFAFLFLKKKDLTLGIEKNIFKRLAIITIILGIAFSSIFLTVYAYDEEAHAGFIATIANGNFPVMSPYIPDYSIQYHYAFDLFGASIKSVTGLGPVRSSDVAMILLFLPLFSLAFAVFYKFFKSTRAAIISAWLLLFAGSWRWLLIVRDTIDQSDSLLLGVFSSFMDLVLKGAPLQSGYFRAYSIDSVTTWVYHRPTLFSVPLILLVLWLIYQEDKRKSIVSKVILGISLGFLSLSSESAFVLIIVNFVIWKLWRLWGGFDDMKSYIKRIFFSIFTVCIIASFVAIFQGGVISDAFLHYSDKSSAGAADTMTSFVIRTVPGLQAYGAFYPFSNFYGIFYLFFEWGIALLLLPFSLYFLIKKRDKLLNFFLVFIGVGLLINFFVDYPVSPRDLVRINCVVFWMIVVISGPVFAFLIEKGGSRKRLAQVMLVVISIPSLMFALRLIPVEIMEKDILILVENKDEEIQVASEVDNIIEPGAAVLTVSPNEVTQLWGRMTYYGNAEEDVIFNRGVDESFSKLIQKKDLDYIKSRGVDYIYVNPKFSSLDQVGLIDRNIDSLEEIYNKDNEYILYKIK